MVVLMMVRVQCYWLEMIETDRRMIETDRRMIDSSSGNISGRDKSDNNITATASPKSTYDSNE